MRRRILLTMIVIAANSCTQLSDPVLGTPDVPASIVAISGNQLAIAFDSAAPLVFEVRDRFGDPVGSAFSNTTVKFTITPVGYPVTTVDADEDGRAAFNWKPNGVGDFTITASIRNDSSTASVQVEVTTLKLLIISQPPAQAPSGVVLSATPSVQLLYAKNDSAYRRAGIPVQAFTTETTVSLAGANVVSDANGIARFPSLTLTSLLPSCVANSVTLRFNATIGFSTPVANVATAVGTGTVTKMRLASAAPPTIVPGEVFGTAPKVQLTNAGGTDVACQGMTITASAVGSTSSLTRSNFQVTTDVAGLATFSQLSFCSSAPAANYALRFTAGALDTLLLTAIPLQYGPAKLLKFVQAPVGVANAATMTPAPSIRLTDNCSNTVATQNKSVSVTTPDTGVTLSNTTAGTNANGLATFSNFSMTGPVGAHVLTFASTGLQSLTDTVGLSAGPIAKLGHSIPPPGVALSGIALPAPSIVITTDVYGNTTGQSGRTITVTGSAGTTLTNNAVNTSGFQAVFNSLTVTAAVGSYVLFWSSAGLTQMQRNLVIATTMTKGTAISGLSGSTSTNTSRYYGIPVPSSSTSFSVTATGVANAELYVLRADLPTTTQAAGSTSCISTGATATKTCTFLNPQAGQWFALLRATGTYASAAITATYAP